MIIGEIIYADILFIINFTVNYVLLSFTGKIMAYQKENNRKIIASVIGALYSCFIFFPSLSILYTIISKVIFSLVITYLAFRSKSPILLIKTTAVFYISSFMLGGITMGLFFVTGIYKKTIAITNNGVIYFNLPWKILFISTAVSYILIKIISGIIKQRKLSPKKEIRINYHQKSTSVIGMVDTGNKLSDPVSKKPVIVCEIGAIKDILPQNMINIFEKNSSDNLDIQYKKGENIRIIPYKCIGKENGIMFGFLSDSIVVEGREFKNITVGVHPGKLCLSENYSALLNPEFVN